MDFLARSLIPKIIRVHQNFLSLLYQSLYPGIDKLVDWDADDVFWGSC